MSDYEAYERDRQLEAERLETICEKARQEPINDDEFLELLCALGILRRKA